MVSRPSPQAPITISSATQAAELAIELAEKAAKSGTFGVGGMMLGPDGKVLFTAQNAVIVNGKVSRPNAHVEWQLVDAYFAAKAKGEKLPPPEKCTVISQLDPCCMCGGALLKGRFNVLTIAMDDYAGVSFKGHGQFDALPENLKVQASKSFGYLGSEGQRPYIGPNQLHFAGSTISPELESRALSAFVGSMDAIRNFVSQSEGVAFNRLRNPRELGESFFPSLKRLRDHDRSSLDHTIKHGAPGIEMASLLVDTARKGKLFGNDFNAASLIDPFGNVLLTMHGREGASPIRTPLIEIVEAYSTVRAQATPGELRYLPHPKHCTLVSLLGPGNDARSLMEIGAYGSTMEREVPARSGGVEPWQYVLPRLPQADLMAMIQKMPPLYSQVIKALPMQVEDEALIRACDNAHQRQTRPPRPRVRKETGRVAVVSGAPSKSAEK